MKKIMLALAIGATALVGPISTSFAAEVPCEEALKTLRATEVSAKPSDADKAIVADLETKGVERCNADDDKRADDFFAQAMKVLGK